MVPTVSDCIFTNNTATGAEGGALSLDRGDILRSLFTGNAATGANSWGGAVSGVENGQLRQIKQSIFTNNSAVNGGAIGKGGYDPGTYKLENSLLAKNTATNYAINLDGNQPNGLEMRYVTLAGNTGGGLIARAGAGDANLVLYDNIITSNGTVGILTDDLTPTINYNDVLGQTTNYGGTAVAGAYDIAANPLFIDPGTYNYALLWGSPAFAAATDLGISVDLLNIARTGHFTMGAYQLVPEPATLGLLALGALALLRRRRI